MKGALSPDVAGLLKSLPSKSLPTLQSKLSKKTPLGDFWNIPRYPGASFVSLVHILPLADFAPRRSVEARLFGAIESQGRLLPLTIVN